MNHILYGFIILRSGLVPDTYNFLLSNNLTLYTHLDQLLLKRAFCYTINHWTNCFIFKRNKYLLANFIKYVVFLRTPTSTTQSNHELTKIKITLIYRRIAPWSSEIHFGIYNDALCALFNCIFRIDCKQRVRRIHNIISYNILVNKE